MSQPLGHGPEEDLGGRRHFLLDPLSLQEGTGFAAEDVVPIRRFRPGDAISRALALWSSRPRTKKGRTGLLLLVPGCGPGPVSLHARLSSI